MSEAAVPAPPAPVVNAPRRRRHSFVRDVLFGERQAVVGTIVIVFFTLVAVLAPHIAPYSVTQQTCAPYAGLSGKHLLGCDDGGIDMFSELMWGARVSLIVGFAAAVVAMVIGGGVGVVSGFFGGRTDIVLMRITDYFLVIPDIPLMIVFAALFGRHLLNIIIIIAIIYWTSTARLIRAQVKSLRERVFVKRSRALGASNTRLIFKHVLPQVTPLLIANTVLMVAIAMFAETYVAFLGLGDPTQLSWGLLISNAFQGGAMFRHAWWAIVTPGLCVTIVILACTIVGQSMEDAMNPRLKVGHLSVKRFGLRPIPTMRPAPGRWREE